METKNKDLINTFYYLLPNNGSTEGLNSTTRRYEEAKQCALIAEDFATEFGKWLNNKVINRNGIHHHLLGVLKVDNLLAIFKKEKGL